jgi:hypothetical protein
VPKRRNLDRKQLALALEPRDPPLPAIPNAKGLVEALADLLLEALGAQTAETAVGQGGCHEPQDHG